MKKHDRVELIKRIAKQLQTQSWTDIDLTLSQFGFPTTSTSTSDRYSYCVQNIEDADDDSLRTLGNYLFSDSEEPSRSLGRELPWRPNQFRLFLSHVSTQKEFVSAVKFDLATCGIDGFVAHEDIEPTKKWVEEIEIALETCDALATVLTTGFHQSKWTDQEVGFCVARRVLIIPVRFDVDPYGFISRYQGFTPKPKRSTEVAHGLFDILCKHDLTADKMGAALVSHFADSNTFAEAKANVKLLRRVKTWTPEMLRDVEKAVEKNNQISESFGVPDAVRAIVKEHGK